jgi:hypothetical protein
MEGKNYMEMCRFFPFEDSGYKKLKLALESFMAKAG